MSWCAISKTKKIGPFFFGEGSATVATYKDMLIRYAFPRFSELGKDHIFMQDGASTHYSIPVRNYLNRKRPNNQIGSGGRVNWPARSPDLTPCAFFLWSHTKAKLFLLEMSISIISNRKYDKKFAILPAQCLRIYGITLNSDYCICQLYKWITWKLYHSLKNFKR